MRGVVTGMTIVATALMKETVSGLPPLAGQLQFLLLSVRTPDCGLDAVKIYPVCHFQDYV